MAKNKVIWMILFLLLQHTAWTQVNRYVVIFKDKANTAYSISDPIQFLSQKAIDRRTRQGISITEQDIPVNTAYLQGVEDAGADVFYKTRWMNGALIQCDATALPAIQALSYVERVEYVAPNAKLANGRRHSTFRTKATKDDVTQTQLSMVGIDDMQADGFKGEGISIAVLDGGFPGVNTAAPFQPIFADNRLNVAVSHDFVYNTSNVFQYDDHGTEVFSVIAAYQEGTFTGGAYRANYQLYVTEDASTEYRIEEYNWLFAAERADSAGVDVIHTSLGYYNFDDPSMDYPQSAMNGETAVVTRAAQWASDRGIAVICSAGNEGSIAWQIITAPADARDVLAIGSVTAEGARVPSSSKGPSADGRIKPDVAALGSSTKVILPNGAVGAVSGTSLSAPIVTSLVAGVWQRYPSLTNKEILEVIRRSGSQASAPDNLLGYGIPDYNSVEAFIEKVKEDPFEVYPNPVMTTTNSVTIKPFATSEVSSCRSELISMQGQLLLGKELSFTHQQPSDTVDLTSQATGLYILRLYWNNKVFTYKLVKQ